MTAFSPLERLRLSTRSENTDVGADASWLTHDNLRGFVDIYQSRQLSAVFQPILDFRARQYVAYEGLIRGPADSPFASPKALFGLARQMGISVEFESLCRHVIIKEFVRLGLSGRLFLNASPAALTDHDFIDGGTARLMDQVGLRPGRVVIELTENQRVTDYSALREVLELYRQQGYRIAVDDLGEGFSNLRIWSEVRPDFVKIDRHFISGIADDALKFQLVRAMHEIADTCHVRLIAEGIETDAEFASVCDLGIDFGQGFLIAKPSPVPHQRPSESVLALVKRGSIIVFPRATPPDVSAYTARKLLLDIAPASPDCDNDHVFNRFESDPALIALPVVAENGTPRGLINRYSLIDRFARPFRRELFGRKPCSLFMDSAPLIVDADTSIQELGLRLSSSAQHHLIDGFIITENGCYIGIGSSHSLMAMITDMQIRAARYANPLTQLPGNVPINEHIDRLLGHEAAFAACYCDIDNFKPYNDTYGYRKGDELIQFLGALLIELRDARLDFVGHVGGDDFILLLQSQDWQQRLTSVLRLFDDGMADFLAPEHLRAGGYTGEDRKGRQVFHPVPTISVGCLVIDTVCFSSHHEVSAAIGDAKKQAKKMPGSALFIERRKPGGERVGPAGAD